MQYMLLIYLKEDVFEMTPVEQGRSILSHSSQAIKPAAKLFATDPQGALCRIGMLPRIDH